MVKAQHFNGNQERSRCEAVQAEAHRQGVFDSWGNIGLTLRRLDGLGAGDSGLVVESVDPLVVLGTPKGPLLIQGGTGRQRAGDSANDLDDGIADPVPLETPLDALMTVNSLARGGHDLHHDASSGHTPCSNNHRSNHW